MSNAGQAILTVAGTIVGAYFGYPQLGFVLGSLAGQALFPTQLPGVTGPKLTDRQTTSAQVGDPVPWIFGVDFSTGTVIWLDEVETVEQTESQGKGGPSQDFTTFTYFQSIAIGICGTYPTVAYGPGTKQLSRVWENGKLVYDVRIQQPGESDVDYASRLVSSATYAETFVFYDGSEDQEPDPTIEAVRGIGNTPAFKGLCYVVYPRRQLQDTQAQRHPSFRFEVSNCVAGFESLKVYDSPGTFTWIKPVGLVSADVLPIGAGGGGQSGYTAHPDGVGISTGGTGGGGGGASFETYDANELGASETIVVGRGGDGGVPSDVTAVGGAGTSGGASSFGDLVAPGGFAGGIGGTDGQGGQGTLARGGAGGGGGIDGADGDDTTGTPVGNGIGKPAGAGGGGGGGGTQFDPGQGGDGGDGEADPDGPPPGAGGGLGGVGATTPALAGPGFAGNPSLIRHGGGGGGGGGGCKGTGDGGQGASGGLYGGGGGGGGGTTLGDPGFGGVGGDGAHGIVIVNQQFGDNDPCDNIGSLGRIVAAICERCGLTTVNVQSINETFVHGYAVARHLNGRSAIDPLRSVGWFDCVESGRELKFVKRGGAIVATITTADMGAREYGGTPIPAITTKKTQDVELPRIVRVHYFAISRDYEFGEAVSPARISSEAVNEIDVELPITLSDQMALETAEALWSDGWTGRYTHETTLPSSWIELEGTDPIQVPVDDVLQRMRIVTIQESSLLLRKLALVRDDDDNYEPVAVAVDPQRPPSTIDTKAPTLLIVLDLPPLRAVDDDPGVYAAVAPATGATWTGAVIYRSCDNELTWDPLTSGLAETLMGTLVTALPAHSMPETQDMGNVLEVTIPAWAATTPSSATLAELADDGVNAFAIGAPGRWEVGQFETATQTGPTTWELTGLFRGRRGTEHVMGSSQVGDRFVLLNPATLTRLPVAVGLIGEVCTYRPVTFATTFTSGADQDVEHEHVAEALVPFSPVDITATREMSGDIEITANRRDRLAFTLPEGAGLPMSEDTEAFEVDVVRLGNVIRTITGLSSPAATYTAAQQVTDGTTSATDLSFRMFQLSATVGRGSAGEGTLST